MKMQKEAEARLNEMMGRIRSQQIADLSAKVKRKIKAFFKKIMIVELYRIWEMMDVVM